MKVKIHGFAGQNHSWALVHQNIARSLVKKGHDVHIISTNGLQYFPEDLKQLLRPTPDKSYDMQISYTAMKNFPAYLANGDQNRFGIWNYETTVLPFGFAKYYKCTDKFLPSSNFSKKIFMDNGIPEEHMVVVPHGADLDLFASTTKKYPLKTKAHFKIGAILAQGHIRKNIPGLFEAFGRAFTKDDCVCLVAKVNLKKQKEHQFDVDFMKIFESFKRKYPKHAEVELVTEFVPNIAEIYNACDASFTMTYSECFHLPSIEALAANKLVISPNYGGQLDFLNKENSLLIDGKTIPAPKELQYWASSPYAAIFEPDINHAAELLRTAYSQYDSLLNRFSPSMKAAIKTYNWDSVTDQIIGLAI